MPGRPPVAKCGKGWSGREPGASDDEEAVTPTGTAVEASIVRSHPPSGVADRSCRPPRNCGAVRASSSRRDVGCWAEIVQLFAAAGAGQ